MLPRICYLGDDDFNGAAIYLAGIMAHFGLPYDHVASPLKPADSFELMHYALYVVSDYPAARFREAQLAHLAECVHGGSGLLMLGGWESFFGRLGEYHRSPLVDVLPVIMAGEDDRRNCAQPCLIHKVAEHPILDGLPWNAPPGIGGFNAFRPKLGAATLLEAIRFQVRRAGDRYEFTPAATEPLLVVGECGSGRTAALATDVAPHWVGGLVDWGDGRVVEDVEGGFIDVGNWYARFFRNLLVWTGRLDAV
ncbi:MAG: hypothetical protein GXY83_00570 [Rhodopirellula sp.]|nr:hypothetical protein [Rhodopirellula sp.]